LFVAAAQFAMAILGVYSTLAKKSGAFLAPEFASLRILGVPVRDNPLSLLIFYNLLSLTLKGGGNRKLVNIVISSTRHFPS
jgi:hypothetical protein